MVMGAGSRTVGEKENQHHAKEEVGFEVSDWQVSRDNLLHTFPPAAERMCCSVFCAICIGVVRIFPPKL